MHTFTLTQRGRMKDREGQREGEGETKRQRWPSRDYSNQSETNPPIGQCDTQGQSMGCN